MLVTSALMAQISNSEKQALIDLFEATNGSHWSQPWILDEPVEHWNGVTIENDEVVGISLLFNNMQGTLPSSLANLRSLRVLELSFNNISGDLPESLGSLTKLEVLAFNGNNLMGAIPESFGNLHSLKQLHLSSNNLSGSIPVSLGELNNLEVFNVFDNNLVGMLPLGLINQPYLQELIIAENNLFVRDQFSDTLLSNSGAQINFDDSTLAIPAHSIIAIEESEDNN